MPLDTSEFMDAGNWFTMPLIARLKPGVDIARVGATTRPAAPALGRRRRDRALPAPLPRARRGRVRRAGRHATCAQQFSTAAAPAHGRGRPAPADRLRQPRRPARRAQRDAAARAGHAAGAWRQPRAHHPSAADGKRRCWRCWEPCRAAAGHSAAAICCSALMPPDFGPISVAVAPDSRVLAFALRGHRGHDAAVRAAPGVAGGQLGCCQRSIAPTRAPSTARVHVGRTLVVAQFALSLVLVAGAAALPPHAREPRRTSKPVSTATMCWSSGSIRRGPATRASGCARSSGRCSRRSRACPACEHVHAGHVSPFNGNIDGRRLSVPGVEPRDPDDTVIQVNLVGPGYFEAFQVPILRGGRSTRAISRTRRASPSSAKGSPAAISATSDTAIGRRFTTGGPGRYRRTRSSASPRDVRYQDLRAPSERLAYLPWFQAHRSPAGAIRVRGANRRQPRGAGQHGASGNPAPSSRRADSRDPHDGGDDQRSPAERARCSPRSAASSPSSR